MKGLVGAMVFMTLLLLGACEKLTQPRLGPELVSLKPAAVLVTEAWLQVKAGREDPAVTVVLERDGQAVQQVTGLQDTVLADSGLMPNRRYEYRLHLYREGQSVGRTPGIRITTMDTTSHDFEWEIIEFPSPYGSGALYDVAIIDENDIWAVGEIYSDSAQPWLPYNAVHWDGERWELKRVPFIGPCSAVDYPPLKTVWAFDEQMIYFSNGGSIVHFDGNKFDMDCGMNPLLVGAITKIWGTDSTNLYIVGGSGTIAHYDGRRWGRIESGVDLDFQDIWGSQISGNATWEVIGIASERALGNGYGLFRIMKDKVELLSGAGLSPSLKTIWFHSGFLYILGGDGLYWSKFSLPLRWMRLKGLPRLYKRAVRGSDINNIFVAGAYGLLLHYNGINWRRYSLPLGPVSAFNALSVKLHQVVGVGFKNSAGFVVIGRRVHPK